MFERDCQLNGRITGDGDPVIGVVKWDGVKSIWFSSMLLGWLSIGITYFSWSALCLFFITATITLCGGHSLGMHRRLIHNSFDCSPLLEKLGVYLGTLVGLGGPFTMMHTHDIRDWAQRNPQSHDYFGHRRNIVQDFLWQVHCKLELRNQPAYVFPAELSMNRFYIWLQRTSMLQQLPWALVFYVIGGWGWVAWGICARVTISIFGHWLIGHFAHGDTATGIHVRGASVQGRNVPLCGLITFGECWHNNHHAYPGCARIGLTADQLDPGWWTLLLFERLGLVWNIKRPEDMEVRAILSSAYD